ncbi:MAG: hypothetical protein HWE23_07355 [Rhodobacteraceae bacterium]|nr:hypothetical protein [Paracoccaceae bacterium]
MPHPIRPSLVADVARLALVSLVMTSPAHAFTSTGDEVADAFLTILDGRHGAVEDYDSVSLEDGLIVFSGLKLEGKSAFDNLAIQTTEITNGALSASGTFEAEEISLNGIAGQGDDVAFTLEHLTMSELSAPTGDDFLKRLETTPHLVRYRESEIRAANIQLEDREPVSLGRAYILNEDYQGNTPTKSQFIIEDLHMPKDALDRKEKRTLEGLGYEAATFDVRGFMSWSPEEGTVDLDDLSVDLQDGGSLRMSFSLGGFTEELMASLQDPDTEDSSDAMSTLQALKLNKFSANFEDNSLTQRALKLRGEQLGGDESTAIKEVETTLPMMLSMLNNEAFSKSIQSALSTFMEDPQNLSITATPPQPVSAAEILGLVLLSPQMIPTLLNAKVSANQ